MSKLYRTFKDSVTQYVDEQEIHKKEIRDALKDYAEWLDSFQVVSKDFEIAALKSARKIDRELIEGLLGHVDPKKAEEIILFVSNRHRHYSQWQDRQNQRGGKNLLTGLNWLNKRFTAYAWLTWRLRKLLPQSKTLQATKPSSGLPQEMQNQINENRDAQKGTE